MFRYVPGFIAYLLLFIVFTQWVYPVYASSVNQPINEQKLVPVSLLEWKSKPGYAVLVDKTQQKVMLYHSDDLSKPEKVYQCSTGENNGPKSKKNDRKTPEGIYFFTNSYVDKYLSPIYGAGALPISYPNLIDRMEGRGGYGIWFHGTNKSLKPNDTSGCIALENEDIEDLAHFITLFDTPIIISSRIEMIPPAELEKEKQELTEIIENWRAAWQGKDIEKYMSFYNSRFTSGGKNWDQWREYKTRLAERYSRINVDIQDPRIFLNDGVILATFKQNYSTPVFNSKGTKMLYLTKNSDQWKIIGENFKGDEKHTTPAPTPPVYSFKEVESFVYSWKDAWEKKDLIKYISCYDKDFQSRDMNLGDWENHRERLNKKYGYLKIEIKELNIKRISQNSAKVSFIQNYMADTYEDIGHKELIIVKKDKYWKIKEEKWTPIN
ncbi:L,D-transpeptidase family protein [Deltaproteobacteria bacterium]|nr:L,D-transpeptidase family protein [Deltaproteobacteria bacterium]